MNRKMIVVLLLILSTCFALGAINNIIIREATKNDLPELCNLDKVVSYEYFFPMYSVGYTHLPLGKNPGYYLDLELEADTHWFSDCIEKIVPEKLWVAYDQDNNVISGFVIAHQSSAKAMEIDLLLLLKDYRRQGIGKKLIQHAIVSFPGISVCEVYPLKFANENTLRFYQSIGFVNQGIPKIDKVNIYGVPYAQMYYYFTYYIKADSHASKRPPLITATDHQRGIR